MANKLKILYAEDNNLFAQLITQGLEQNGYNVNTVYNGNEAWLSFQETSPDIILLSYSLRYKTGLELFNLIRQQNPAIPILIISSHANICPLSLKMGVCDFIHKNCSMDEICARIEAAWQRKKNLPHNSQIINTVYKLSDISSYNINTSTLNIGNDLLPLNRMLSKILTLLCQNFNMHIPKKTICKIVWNNDNQCEITLLCNYISKLRKILKADTTLEINSSYGKGYCLKSFDK